MIKINGEVITHDHFRDNTLKVTFNPFLSGPQDLCKAVDFLWLYEDDSELFMLQCLVDHVDTVLFNPKRTLVLPYIPHARMDRTKSANDVFTLKTFCKIINAMNFTSVMVFDPHSDVSTALLDRCYLYSYARALKNFSKDILPNDAVHCFPDAGAAKRYSSDTPYTFGVKKRNWETHEIESLVIADPEVVNGKDVIIRDDICSFGGTFVRAAQALKDAGARDIYLIVSHCEKNIFLGDVFKCGNIKKVITSNSIIRDEDVPAEYADQMTIIKLF